MQLAGFLRQVKQVKDVPRTVPRNVVVAKVLRGGFPGWLVAP